MKKLFFTLALAALFAPELAAQSAFGGTWKIDKTTVELPKREYEHLLQDGKFGCKTCAQPIPINADATDQSNAGGDPTRDTIAARIVSDHKVELTSKKAGKVVGMEVLTVSSDGDHLTSEYTDSTRTNGGPPVIGRGELKRIANGPVGSHPVSGKWLLTEAEGSDNAVTWTFKVNGDAITYTTPTGQTFTAKVNGAQAQLIGDPNVTTVALKDRDRFSVSEVRFLQRVFCDHLSE
jgi:hypothetical protein